jgi:hypothetical protein
MAITQADVDNLERAMASGVKQVMEGGRMITYDSYDSMRDRLAWLKASLANRPTSYNVKVRFRNE